MNRMTSDTRRRTHRNLLRWVNARAILRAVRRAIHCAFFPRYFSLRSEGSTYCKCLSEAGVGKDRRQLTFWFITNLPRGGAALFGNTRTPMRVDASAPRAEIQRAATIPISTRTGGCHV